MIKLKNLIKEEKQKLNEGIDLHSHVHRVKSHLAVFKSNIDAKRGGSFDSDSYEYEKDRWENDSKMLKARDKALKKWSDKSIKVLMTIIKDYEKAWKAK